MEGFSWKLVLSRVCKRKEFSRTSLKAVWSKTSQRHEMFCHNPEAMGSNPSSVKLRGVYIVLLSVYKLDLNKNYGL